MEVVLLLVGIAGVALIVLPRLQRRADGSPRPARRRSPPGASGPSDERRAGRDLVGARAAVDIGGWDDDLGWENVETSPPAAREAWDEWRATESPLAGPAEPAEPEPRPSCRASSAGGPRRRSPTGSRTTTGWAGKAGTRSRLPLRRPGSSRTTATPATATQPPGFANGTPLPSPRLALPCSRDAPCQRPRRPGAPGRLGQRQRPRTQALSPATSPAAPLLPTGRLRCPAWTTPWRPTRTRRPGARLDASRRGGGPRGRGRRALRRRLGRPAADRTRLGRRPGDRDAGPGRQAPPPYPPGAGARRLRRRRDRARRAGCHRAARRLRRSRAHGQDDAEAGVHAGAHRQRRRRRRDEEATAAEAAAARKARGAYRRERAKTIRARAAAVADARAAARREARAKARARERARDRAAARRRRAGLARTGGDPAPAQTDSSGPSQTYTPPAASQNSSPSPRPAPACEFCIG